MAARAWEWEGAWEACPVPGCCWRRKRGHTLCFEHWRELPPAVRASLSAWAGGKEESRRRKRVKELAAAGVAPAAMTVTMVEGGK